MQKTMYLFLILVVAFCVTWCGDDDKHTVYTGTMTHAVWQQLYPSGTLGTNAYATGAIDQNEFDILRMRAPTENIWDDAQLKNWFTSRGFPDTSSTNFPDGQATTLMRNFLGFSPHGVVFDRGTSDTVSILLR